jgi:GT2 family glycosyltransferase
VSVAVVICAFSDERWELLVDAVGSLRTQSRRPDEVVVVIDNNPGLLARAATAFPEAAVVANEGRQGLSGARNTGVGRACSEIVAFLDDDAKAAPDWLERLADCYADGTVAGVGGWIEPDWVSGRPAWFPAEFDWVVGCSYRGLPEERSPVRNVIGANMSFRRQLLDEAGGFRSDLGRVGRRPLGCEETELCMRIGRLHPELVIVHEPLARVLHHVPAERASWRYFKARCYGEGLSKATVARVAGARGLSSERAHALRTLPRGIARDLVRGAVGRSVASAAGLAITTAGYLVGSRRAVAA